MTLTIVKEIVKDFLTVPGIAGFGLMDGQSDRYFCNIDGSLVLQQEKLPLLQSVTQVLMTIPLEYQAIAWQWPTYQVYLHRIDSVQLLMVLAQPQSHRL
jgi:hypothetical protein